MDDISVKSILKRFLDGYHIDGTTPHSALMYRADVGYLLGLVSQKETLMDDPALHAASREEQGQKCPVCEYTWDVLGLSEYGAWSPFDENDLICPECNKNLMEV